MHGRSADHVIVGAVIMIADKLADSFRVGHDTEEDRHVRRSRN